MKNILPNTNYSYPSVNYSPFLNTKFYEVYKDVEIVQKAYKEGIISLKILEYLYLPNNPLNIKAAIINSLDQGVDFEGCRGINHILFKYYLALIYKVPIEKLNVNSLSADELFCLGYLTFIDTYNRPEKVIPLLESPIYGN
jgi:hypothetical protein